jgi:hypothetical protein
MNILFLVWVAERAAKRACWRVDSNPKAFIAVLKQRGCPKKMNTLFLIYLAERAAKRACWRVDSNPKTIAALFHSA